MVRPFRRIRSMAICLAIAKADRASNIPVCHELLALEPRSFLALALLAEYHWRAGEEDNALEFANRASEVVGNDFRVLRILAAIHADRGEKDQTRAYASKLASAERPPWRILRRLSWFLALVFSIRHPRAGYRTLRGGIDMEDLSDAEWLAWAGKYASLSVGNGEEHARPSIPAGMDVCPHCGVAPIPAGRKLRATPAWPLQCPACGQYSYPRTPFLLHLYYLLTLPLALVVLFIITLPPPWAVATACAVAISLALWWYRLRGRAALFPASLQQVRWNRWFAYAALLVLAMAVLWRVAPLFGRP